MGHSKHFDSNGQEMPSVSKIPAIYAKNMDGFEDYICKGIHTKGDRCCVQAKRQFYQESADLGNDIHTLREAFLRGQPFADGVPEYQANVFEPIARFYKENGYKPLELPDGTLAIETQMTGATFGGSLDGAGTFSFPFWEGQRVTFWDKVTRKALEGEKAYWPTTTDVWIEDLKIKSKLEVTHPLQLYGYRLLLQEVHGITADWGLIIRREKKLDKTPEIQLRGYFLPAYEEYWNASLKMWRFLNE